ncbi:hypothetical protein ACWDT6_00860 [Nocardia grenadensis]|uniref:hypothetical protein n=1 Tax=Nocardia grenadensis TaxID=931537 RepID=UPI003D70C7B0
MGKCCNQRSRPALLSGALGVTASAAYDRTGLQRDHGRAHPQWAGKEQEQAQWRGNGAKDAQ